MLTMFNFCAILCRRDTIGRCTSTRAYHIVAKEESWSHEALLKGPTRQMEKPHHPEMDDQLYSRSCTRRQHRQNVTFESLFVRFFQIPTKS